MAVTEDIILRILSESSQTKQDLVALKASFESALSSLTEAASRADFDPISQDAIQLRSEVVRLGKEFVTAFNAAKNDSKELSQVVNLVNKEVRATESALRSEAKELSNQARLAIESERTRRSEIKATGDIARESERTRRTEIKTTSDAARSAEAARRVEAKATADVTKAVEATRRQQIKASSDAAKAASRIELESVKTAETAKRAEIRASADAARAAARESARASREQKSSVDQVTTAYTGLKNVLASLGLALGIREFIDLGKEAVNTTVRIEALQAQLSAAAGSAKAGADAFRFVVEQSDRLGQSYFVVGEATARFEAATRTSNLTLEQRRHIITSVLEASRVLQLSEQRLNNTLLALEQIASKGTVSLEELRRQLGDNIPGAVQILAKELGVTVAELFRMIEANEVLSEVALPALARGLDKTFGAGLDAALDTKATKLGQARNLIIQIKDAAAGGFADELFRGLESGVENISTVRLGFQSLGSVVGNLIGIVIDLSQAIDGSDEALANLANRLKEIGISGVIAGELLKGNLSYALILIRQAAENAELNKLSDQIDKVTTASERAQAVASLSELFSRLQDSGRLTGDQLEILRGKSSVLLQSFEKLGDDVPEHLREIPEELRKINDELDSLFAAEKLEEIADKLRNIAPEDQKLRYQVLSDSISSLSSTLRAFAGDAQLTSEQIEPFQTTISILVSEIRNAGQEVPRDLLDIQVALSALASEFTTSAEEIRTSTDQVKDKLAEISAARKAFLDEIRKDAEEAAQEALNIAAIVEDFASANATQLETIKEATQKALDGYLLLGEELPPLFAGLVNELGVVSSVAEKELKKQEEAAKKAAKEEKKAIEERIKNYQKLLESIRDITRELQPEIRADDISGEISDLQSQLNALESKPIFDPGDQEKIDALKDKIFELRSELEGLQQGFDTTSATIEDVDEAISELLEGNAEAFAQLTQSQRSSIANLLSGLQSLASNGQATGGAVVDIFRQVAGVLDEAGVNTESLYEAFGQLDGQGLNVANMLDRLVRSVEESEVGQEGLANQAKKTTEELEEQRKKIGELVVEIEKLSTRGVEAMRPFLDIMSETLAVCEQLRDCINDMGR